MMAFGTNPKTQNLRQKKVKTNNIYDRKNEVDSARLNFVSANIPINGGNFTHRVPPTFQSNAIPDIPDKKQILKNLKQIKTNN